MTFDAPYFFVSFAKALDETRGRTLAAKTHNADDTLRVFQAAEAACNAQSAVFPANGVVYCNAPGSPREFLCDFTFHNPHQRILLALESEWGVLASSKQTVEAVLFDFKKVINMAAPVKATVFAYVDDDNKKTVLGAMAALIAQWQTETLGTLITIACPWHDELYSASIEGFVWQHGEWDKLTKE